MKRNPKFQSNRKSNSNFRRATLKDFKSFKKDHSPVMSVARAYDIVAGYMPSDSGTFDRAVKVLRDNKVNKKFISLLVDMHKQDVSFENVRPDVYAANLQAAYTIFNHSKQWETVVLAQPEVRKALNSITISGNEGIVTDEDRQKVEVVIVNTAIAKTVNSFLISPEPVNASKENVSEMIANQAIHTIATQRAEELRERDVEQTQVVDNLNKASDFTEHMEVKGNRFTSFFRKVKNNVQTRLETAVKSAYKEVKIAANKCQKAAAVVFAAVTLTATVASCGPNTNSNDKGNAAIEVVEEPETPTPEPEVTKVVKAEVADTIAVPTEYSADMNLRGGAAKFNMLKKYYGERFGAAYKYLASHDSLLVSQDGESSLTVMQAMDQLRGHHDMKPSDKTLQKVMKTVTACEDEIHENITQEDMADLFTPIPRSESGNHNRTVGLNYPDCNSYKTKQVISAKKKAPVMEIAPADTLNNDPLTITEGAGEIRLNTDTTTVYTPSEVLGAQYEKSNVNNKGDITDTKVLGDVPVQKVLNVKVDDKSIKVEKTDAPVSTPKAQDAEDVSVVFMKGNEQNLYEVLGTASVDDVLNLKVDANKTIKVAGAAASATADADQKASQSTTLSFTSEGETFTFDDEDSVSVSTPVSLEKSDVTDNTTSTFTADEQSDSVQIIIGTEGVEPGTPSAGYVDERGGYNNTGLSKRVNDSSKKYYNKNVPGTYENRLETLNNHPELFERGNVFEGLVPEQALVVVDRSRHWSNRKEYREFQEAMEKFFKCEDIAWTAEQVSTFQGVVSNITTTGADLTVKGNKKIRADGLIPGEDCDTDDKVNYVATNDAIPALQGKMMPRIFRLDMPITINEGQGEMWINTFVEQKEVPSKAIRAQYEKSNVTNEGKITDTKVIKQVSPNEVVDKVNVNPKKTIKVQKKQRTLADVRREHGRGYN